MILIIGCGKKRKEDMKNNDKKKIKLQDRIKDLEDNLIKSLTQKTSSKELNIGAVQAEILKLKKELATM
jgi:hypothetical protein